MAGVAPTLDEIQSAETLARLYARKASEWNEVDGGFSGLGIKSFLFPKGRPAPRLVYRGRAMLRPTAI